MENKISEGYFFANAAAYFRCKHVFTYGILVMDTAIILHQQYGTYHEFNNDVL